MATVATWNKGAAPAGTNGWLLTPDIRAALESMNVIVPVADAAERDGITPPLGKYAGMTVVRKDIAGTPLEVWDGAVWVRFSRSYAKAVGVAAIGGVGAGGTAGPFTQSFPAGRFTVPPIVIVTTDQTRLVAVAANITTTGFDLYMTNLSAGSSATGQMRWVAEQMTAASAVG